MNARMALGMLVGFVVACGVLVDVASADAKYTLSLTPDYTASPWTHENRYLDQSKEKLVFGGKNTLLGWMELYNEPRDMARSDQSVMKGLGHGFINMLGDTIGGAVHVVTFPITAVDVTLPEGGTDLL